VSEALDDAELLERLDTAIADGGRLLAELGRTRELGIHLKIEADKP
jgi:hypothetical protein